MPNGKIIFRLVTSKIKKMWNINEMKNIPWKSGEEEERNLMLLGMGPRNATSRAMRDNLIMITFIH